MWIAIVVALMLLPLLLIAAAAVYSKLLYSPSIDREIRGQLLILAAHPDDCVIVAGEYAQEIKKAGGRVRVVYLTAGDTDPKSERTRIRREESIASWATIGVPAEDFTFLELPETPVGGASPATPEQVDEAGRRLADLLFHLPKDAVVFLPAAGETHPDHRLLRDMTIKAIQSTSRADLRLMEAPEYNPYVSLTRSPVRAILYIAQSLPVVTRMVGTKNIALPPAFFDGPPGRVLAPDEGRLRVKREMLRKFESEKGELLVHLFGFPDRYRPVDMERALRGRDGRMFLPVGERLLSPSVTAVWLLIWTALLVGAFLFAKTKIGLFGGSYIASGVTAALGIALVAFAAFRRQSPERRITNAIGGMGLVAGTLAAEEVVWEFVMKLFKSASIMF